MRDLIAEVWEAMAPYEYYSPRDIANTLGVTVEQVWRVMDFLIRYRFLDLISSEGVLVKRTVGVPSPEIAALLLAKLPDPSIGRKSP